jgi:hypothetical protein
MKRAILVLMVVVFALVTVVPTFALSQDFHGVTVPQVVDPSNAAVDYFGDVVDEPTVPEEGIIAILRQGVAADTSSLTVRKAGGESQD